MHDLVIRLGSGRSKWLIVLRDWQDSSEHLSEKMMAAIRQHLIDKYGQRACLDFDHIEILGYDVRPQLAADVENVTKRLATLHERHEIKAMIEEEIERRRLPDDEITEECTIETGILESMLQSIKERK